MNIRILIQARLSSTRMPGKVLQEFAGTLSILALQLKGLSTLDLPIVLATTTNPNDDALERFASTNEIECFRGSENDVLGRFLAATEAKYIIRICSDNPFLDIASITKFIEQIEEDVDYVSFKNSEGTPAIRTHWGLFAEVVSRKALERAHQATGKHAEGKFYREHVTNYIYGNPDEFKVKLLDAPTIIKNRNDLRFTIDTPEDFENMQRLYQTIEKEGGDFSLENLVHTADAHPEIKKVMAEGIARFSK
jgi:spore coat polysaccharide biosynthesis protein SpsF